MRGEYEKAKQYYFEALNKEITTFPEKENIQERLIEISDIENEK